ncbi:inactive protein tyrosine kinase pTKL-like [Melitaea cinxia]|uniref:inactive protein tyrosine kinase pTKL-like n=1 Tax=Melitaea cinxia TaxID=113334 RepID=UPI001E270DDF|nr:inactive protein tyrosine kinase pTKL-like [Melitaea cinxia]
MTNIIYRCLQFPQNYKLILNSYKNISKNRKKRSASYKIGIVTILKRRRRIKNKRMRRKKQKATFNHQIEKNKSHTIKNACNTMTSQSKTCIDVNKDDISRNLQINCKNITNNCDTDKANKKIKHLTKHKYTMEKSYQGIKRFLKCYSSYINGMSDSKKKYKIRKYQTKIKLSRHMKKIKSDFGNQNGINRRGKGIQRNYGIFAYLLYRFKVKFCKDYLKKKAECDLAIPLKEDDNERKNNLQGFLANKKDFSLRTEDNSLSAGYFYEKSMINEVKNLEAKDSKHSNLCNTEQKQEIIFNTTQTIVSSESDESVNAKIRSSSEISEKRSITVSTFSLSYDTRSENTLTKIVDFEHFAKEIGTKNNKIKVKAESNRGIFKNYLLLNARSLKNDWWSPMPNKRM